MMVDCYVSLYTVSAKSSPMAQGVGIGMCHVVSNDKRMLKIL